IFGAISSTYSPAPTSTTSYWCRVTDNSNGLKTTDSSTATITVNPALAITTQPANATINLGQSDTLSVSASGGSPITATTPYSYQWYTGNSGDTSHPISGATGNSYTATPANTTSYWVQVSDAANGSAGPGVIASNTATITVKLIIDQQP